MTESSCTPAVLRAAKPRLATLSPNHPRTGCHLGKNDHILTLPDGSWLLIYSGIDTVHSGIGYYGLIVFHSADEGKTRKIRSRIRAKDDNLGAGFTNEHPFIMLPNGTIVLLVRRSSARGRYSDGLSHFISTDEGRIRKERPDLSITSTLPTLTILGDDLVAIYGRPGVYIRTSKDGIHFTKSVPLIGPSEENFMPHSPEWWDAEIFKYSCANADVLKLDENSLLVAYSDFQYEQPDGMHKAIYVVKVTKE